MKNKLISVGIIFIFIFTSLFSVEATASIPRIDLNDYEINSTDKNNVYVSGVVSIAKGQNIGLFDSTGKIPLNYITIKNTNTTASFKIQVPPRFLKDGTNTFKVISLPVRGTLNASSPKTVTIKIVTTKKNQTITCNNLSLKINEKVNLNAKVNSNLPLVYKSSNPNIATVDCKGYIVGRKLGTTKVTISQSGNDEYNPVNKMVTITVINTTSGSKTNIANTKVSGITNSYVWLSKAVKPVPKLTYGNKTLKQNVDYTIAYVNNKEPGTGKLVITGKGNYTGTLNKVFTIYIGDTTKIKKKKGKVTLSGRTFRIYGQNYSGTWNGGESIRGSGCGPAATATIISGYGYNMNTKQVAKASTKYNKKYKRSARGKGQMYYMQSLGFKTKLHYNKNESNSQAEANIKKALRQGHQLWFQVGRGSQKKYWKKFTYGRGWHNIAILSIDKSGKWVYVAGGRKQWCKLSDLAKARLKDRNSRFYLEVWKPVE